MPEDGFVFVLAGDKLPLIVTCAVVEHQFDVAGEDGTRVRIDRMVQLGFDMLEAAAYCRRFPLREVQRFLLAVGEEGIVADMAFQCRAEEEVGVESQQPALVGQRVVVAHPENLAGAEEDHRGVGKIVEAAPAAAASVRTILDKQDGVELELHGILRQAVFAQVDQGGLRMEGLRAQAAVAFADGLQV